MAKNNITIKNVRAIPYLELPVPPEGGVVRIRAANGRGKTWTLKCIEALFRPEARKELEPRDGTESGSIEGLGMRVTVAKTTRSAGQMECLCLESSIDPSEFVSGGGLKDPVLADKRRLAMLIRLLGIPMGEQEWRVGLARLAGDPLAEVVGNACDLVPAWTDPSAVADKLRRLIHEQALAAERETEALEIKARSILATIDGVDTAAESDEKQLRDTLSACSEALVRAQEVERAHQDAQNRARKAQEALKAAAANATYGGPGAAEARTAREQAAELLMAAKSALASAQQVARDAESILREAMTTEQAAISHEEMTEQWRKQIAAGVPAGVPAEVFTTLQADRMDAFEALEAGARIREAQIQQAQAVRATEAALVAQERANRLRTLAKSTDRVLADALVAAGVPYTVQDGRLCIKSPDREGGLEYVADLSMGEAWTEAVALAARRLGAGGVFTVCQEGWEALDAEHERLVESECKRHKLVAYVAQADKDPQASGELRAEVYNGK